MERWLSCRHFIEDGTQRKQIAARSDRSSLNLLRRHVRKRSYDCAKLSLRLRPHIKRCVLWRTWAGDLFCNAAHLCKTEIKDLNASPVIDHDVGRLEITMNNPLFMGGG